MSTFRTGDFDLDRLPVILRPLAPTSAVDSVLDIRAEDLVARGKRVMLLDVDNTLVVWRGNEISAQVLGWVRSMRDNGIEMCLLSNTRNRERLATLSERLDVPFLIGKFKPSRYMYRLALERFHAKPSEAVMVGDQLFTDILGANRTGIEAIWVRQMASRDLVTTKVSRLGERLVRGKLYQALRPAGDTGELPLGGSGAFDLLAHPTVKQFVKFCIIGGSSTVIDIGLYWVLMFHVPYGDQLLSDALGTTLVERYPALFTALATKDGALVAKLAAGPLFKVFSAGVAILNSFVWNRRWTFKIRGREHRAAQLRKFFAIALIGMLLNTFITTSLGNIIPGHEKRSLAIASLVATVLVAFWNFFGQKLWTFKQK